MRRCLSLVVLSLALMAPLGAQAAPGTDIFVMALTARGARAALGPPRNVTARPGYDNQPHFSPDGRRLFYTSIRADGQADIYVLEVATGAASRLTDTPESEFSPTVIPGGGELAVIRVEPDSTQRLWAVPVSGGAMRLLLERVKPVGYQAWIDRSTVALFVLGAPPTLQVANLGTGRSRVLLADLGRSLSRVPGRRAVAVTHRVAEDLVYLTEVDVATGATRPIVRMPSGGEYAVWLADGSLLSAAGNAVLRLRPGVDSAWTEVARFESPELARLSRLAVSPDGRWLALVAEEPARPGAG